MTEHIFLALGKVTYGIVSGIPEFEQIYRAKLRSI